MTQQPKDEHLEQFLDRALRDLPPRRAPVELEARVLEELQRRAALPWWRLSFGYWPLPARCMLLVICGGLVGLTIWDHPWQLSGVQHVTEAASVSLSWASPAMSVIGFAAGTVGVVERSIPVTWLYLGLGFAALLYAMLFGLGAAAYRTLYLQPSSGR
jgi:hypothetical protein